MKKLKFLALVLAVVFVAGSAFTKTTFTSYYWFDTSDVYDNDGLIDPTTEIGLLPALPPGHSYSISSGATLVRKGFTSTDVTGTPGDPINPSSPDETIYSN